MPLEAGGLSTRRHGTMYGCVTGLRGLTEATKLLQRGRAADVGGSRPEVSYNYRVSTVGDSMITNIMVP